MHTAAAGAAELGEEVGDAHGRGSRASGACPWGARGAMGRVRPVRDGDSGGRAAREARDDGRWSLAMDARCGVELPVLGAGPCPTQLRAGTGAGGQSGIARGPLGKLVRYVRLSHGKVGADNQASFRAKGPS